MGILVAIIQHDIGFTGKLDREKLAYLSLTSYDNRYALHLTVKRIRNRESVNADRQKLKNTAITNRNKAQITKEDQQVLCSHAYPP
jgi:hypothetical protein